MYIDNISTHTHAIHSAVAHYTATRHSATQCNTQCNTLQHTATHSATHWQDIYTHTCNSQRCNRSCNRSWSYRVATMGILCISRNLQVSFHKFATNYRALLQKLTYDDKASSASSPPCSGFLSPIITERCSGYLKNKGLLLFKVLYTVNAQEQYALKLRVSFRKKKNMNCRAFSREATCQDKIPYFMWWMNKKVVHMSTCSNIEHVLYLYTSTWSICIHEVYKYRTCSIFTHFVYKYRTCSIFIHVVHRCRTCSILIHERYNYRTRGSV